MITVGTPLVWLLTLSPSRLTVRLRLVLPPAGLYRSELLLTCISVPHSLPFVATTPRRSPPPGTLVERLPPPPPPPTWCHLAPLGATPCHSVQLRTTLCRTQPLSAIPCHSPPLGATRCHSALHSVARLHSVLLHAARCLTLGAHLLCYSSSSPLKPGGPGRKPRLPTTCWNWVGL